MEDFLPKSKFKDKSFLKLREYFEAIISDLENAQKIGIPLDEVKDEFYFIWDAIQKSHDNLEGLLHKDLQLSVNHILFTYLLMTLFNVIVIKKRWK
jgi:hypothetical protein